MASMTTMMKLPILAWAEKLGI